jgi:hypothetical protein
VLKKKFFLPSKLEIQWAELYSSFDIFPKIRILLTELFSNTKKHQNSNSTDPFQQNSLNGLDLLPTFFTNYFTLCIVYSGIFDPLHLFWRFW